MGALALEASDIESPPTSGGAANVITAEERAEWLIDYIVLHQGEGRCHLLRRAVEQIAAAEGQAYARGWSDAVS